MVISKKVMRSKRGERERRAVREGERTGGQRERKSGWWAAPSPPFVMVGIGVASSLPCVVVDVGVASSSSSIFVDVVRCCLSYTAVRRPFVSVARC